MDHDRFDELAAKADDLLGEGRLGVVARLLAALDRLRPGDPPLVILRARLHLAQSEPALAIATLNAVPFGPAAQAEAALLAAKASLALGDHAAAVTQARRAVAARADALDGWGILGLALLELGQVEQAGVAFAAGLACHPTEAGLIQGAAMAARILAARTPGQSAAA